MFLLILDSLGNSELLLILAAALIFFGPRRLPQLSRQLGRSLHEFRRASEDFKRTWEREVNLEDADKRIEFSGRVKPPPSMPIQPSRPLLSQRRPLPRLTHRWCSREKPTLCRKPRRLTNQPANTTGYDPEKPI